MIIPASLGAASAIPVTCLRDCCLLFFSASPVAAYRLRCYPAARVAR